MNQFNIYKSFDNGSYIILSNNTNEKYLATQNLIKGNSVYGEKIVKLEDIEYRIWDPFRSRLAGAILKGLKENPIREESNVLYLGASTGTTVSHVSDIIGNKGILFTIEPSVRVARAFRECFFVKKRHYYNNSRRKKLFKILWIFWFSRYCLFGYSSARSDYDSNRQL